MDGWSPTVVFAVGYAAHLERVGRAGGVADEPPTTARGPTPRKALALALIALARWLAPTVATARGDLAA
jgi:hypothetical protein